MEVEAEEDQTLKQVYKRQIDNNRKGLYTITKEVFGRLTQVIDSMNTRLIEEQMKLHSSKIRPPRFTSFTMQLEAYNLKKAFAIEILNDINLNLVQSESIQKLYTMEHYVIIFTAKRIICVQEVLKGKMVRF